MKTTPSVLSTLCAAALATSAIFGTVPAASAHCDAPSVAAANAYLSSGTYAETHDIDTILDALQRDIDAHLSPRNYDPLYAGFLIDLREQLKATRPNCVPGDPIPVEPDGGIGDGGTPIPGTPIPVDGDGGIGDGGVPIPGTESGPIPVEPDGGIGDGGTPIPDCHA